MYKKKRQGFTLVEMLVVMGIMLILAGGAFLSMGGTGANAKYATAEKELHTLSEAIRNFMISNYNTLNGLTLSTAEGEIMTGSSGNSRWRALNPFLSKPVQDLLDPWGQGYRVTYDWNDDEGIGDLAIFVNADQSMGLIPYGDVDYGDGRANEFKVGGSAKNPNNKGIAMCKRVVGKYSTNLEPQAP